ncbi:MAG: 3-deoxy-7-phosphoheptulonate synthase [Pseudonocardiaceae bacterium]
MIVELRRHASGEDVDRAAEVAVSCGAEPHLVRLRGRPVLVLAGCPDTASALFEGLAGVTRVVCSIRPYELAAREFRPAGTVVCVSDVAVGDGNFVVAAGPCAVESESQLAGAADVVLRAGAPLLRGGAYKPRTSPYSFPGLGLEGLALLAEQRARTGLRVVTEVLEPADVDLVGQYADVLQVGTRNMQNFPLLREVGLSHRPVLLKRGMGATIHEWLLAAEYVLAAGNPDVILCERGIRTFETATRFTLDLAAVPVVKRLSNLPVFVDPSHAAGGAYMVPALLLAAAAVGADGALVDVHPNPRSALCDADQALEPEEFQAVMHTLESQLRSAGRGLTRQWQDLPLVTGRP